jgi:F0F1-type ATP synthase delta subunit
VERLRLPNTVVSPIDVARLLRELESLNDFFVSVKNRQSGTAMQLPKLSRQLDQLSHDNQLNLLDEAHRGGLDRELKEIYERAPKLHISFASEPSAKPFEQILIWMRKNIHPHALITIGLQPAIAAGCVIRTSNRIFDLSLRASLEQERPYLARLIKGAVDGR